MAFPSNNGTKQENLASAWNTARSLASTIKTKAQNIRYTSAASTISANTLLDFITYLADNKLILEKIAGLPGIENYAKEQCSDAALDISGEYNNLVQSINSVITWVISNAPVDANGYLLLTKFAVENNGRTTTRAFSIEETAGFRTVLDALIAAID